MTRYRLTQTYSGLAKVQVWRWWFPFWVHAGTGKWVVKDRREAYARWMETSTPKSPDFVWPMEVDES